MIVTTAITLPTRVLQSHRILYGFSVMIQKQFFRVFQLFVPEVKHFYQKNTWKNSSLQYHPRCWWLLHLWWWLHNIVMDHRNHKMSISYHKNGLVSSSQSVGRWFDFNVLGSENILTKLVAINSLFVSVSRWNSCLEPFCFHVNCIHFHWTVFVHVGSAQLCAEYNVSFYMCSAEESP